MLIMLLLTPIEFSLISSASAAKTGSSCKKVNAKDWDGNKPIVCKKNKSGKLVWTLFGASSQTTKSSATPTPKNYPLSVSLTVLNAIVAVDGDLGTRICNGGGATYPDINANTGVEIRDGNGSLIATAVLGSSTVILNSPWGSHCVFKPAISLKKSDFYQIKIGTRYNKSFSFDDLVLENWKIELSIGK